MVEIYALLDPRDNSLRYIGKANCSRKRLASHLRDMNSRDTPVYRWMRKLNSLGHRPVVEVLVVCSDEDWKSVERRAIQKAREAGVRLLNVADGGDEPYCSPDVRAANGRKAAQSRPAGIMRAYRTLEYHIRIARKRSPHRVPMILAKYEGFKAAVQRHREQGTIEALNDAYIAFFANRPVEAWK